MGGENMPRKWTLAICVLMSKLFGLFIIFVLCVWVWIVLGMLGLVNCPIGFIEGCGILAMTVAMGCSLLWFSEHLGIVRLKDGVENKLWYMFIASLLGAIAAGAVTAKDRPVENRSEMRTGTVGESGRT